MESPESSPSSESFSFPLAEQSILSFWKEKEIFKKSLDKTRNGKNYIFYDGPPFATGLPHHGHIVASTLKDVVPRYFTMKGFYVDRRFGWDCHGLPIEQEIDKKFKTSASDFVAEHGVKRYNDECRGIVDRYVNEWEKTIGRLGRWVDFKNDYKTMDLSFMESTWWVFKTIWDKGLIYQGNKIVPYSPALQTALSNFEAGQNYQDIQDPAVTVLFRTKTDPQTYLAAWTTTPWTLPSNLSLCVHPEIDYVKVRDLEKNHFIIMARGRLEAYKKNFKYEEVQSFKGSELKGMAYQPLFPYFSALESKGYFVVLNDEYVTTSDGTGIVHQAPGFGEDDNRVMKEAGLTEVVVPLDLSAQFTPEIKDFAGMFIKDADKEIIKNLKDRGQLFLQSTMVHSYPMCYRTDTPLIYRAMPQWYLAVEKIKDKMIRANQEITWVPESIKDGRFGKWLENARDWAISRTRVWGTPLPVWINDHTGKAICMGSIAELEKYTGKKVTDLHREYVDDLDFSVAGEAGVYKRIPEVLDCWFESGSMPYAQLHYPFENEEIFKQGFPAEFIAEGLDQTRGWFYTLTVLSAALFDKPAFKNVIVNGMVLAKDGKKMSKRLRNYTPPDELIETFGADSLRLFLINSGLVRAEELRFTDEGVKDMVRRVLLPWFNSFKFFSTYAQADGWKFDSKLAHEIVVGTDGAFAFTGTGSDNILDRWVLSKLQTLVKNVNHEMQNYRLYNVIPELFGFIEDLTNWYIRLNRRRFWEEGLGSDKSAAFSTLYSTLESLSRLMAPFTPFLADHIYQELKSFGGKTEESVHLCAYPESVEGLIDSKLETAVGRMQQVILLGRQKRVTEGVKVKTPLNTLRVIHQDPDLLMELKKLEEYIKIELNVKNVEYLTNESDYVVLSAKPNSPLLGKKLGKDFAAFRPLIESLSSAQVQKIEEGNKINLRGIDFNSEEVLVFRAAKPGTQAVTNRFITIDLDCTLDQELIDEGLAREMVNRIQKTRKDLNFNVSDRIELRIHTTEELARIFKKFQGYVSAETLMVKGTLVDEPVSGASAHEIDEQKFEITAQKI
ncbi:MAG TPA: isoleucine--tRNA ligase [Bacteriovoracaceae bacterium]|nr:isoleucine--tRNA ligase [Bacteriovoracaceae bacterium]